MWLRLFGRPRSGWGGSDPEGEGVGTSPLRSFRLKVRLFGWVLLAILFVLWSGPWRVSEEEGQEVPIPMEEPAANGRQTRAGNRVKLLREDDFHFNLPALGQVIVQHGVAEIRSASGSFLILEEPVFQTGESWSLGAQDYYGTLAPWAGMRRRARTMDAMDVLPTILLDPGHGGVDSGAVVAGQEEKRLCLDLAEWTGYWLEQMGFSVSWTRREDRYVSLGERARMANRMKAGLFVSLHCNAVDSSQPRGVEVYIRSLSSSRGVSDDVAGREVTAGWEILERLGYGLSPNIRGVRRGNFQVLREAEVPAVLVEYGFLSHPGDRAALMDPCYRTRAGAATALAIRDWALRFQ